ncbi:hypothetical protein GGP41_005490, partial [Bipolaris sorokiniana]
YAKGIVYCRSRQLCDEIATAVGCSSYHAGVGSRTVILEQWRQRGGLIVYTSALGVGVDITGVGFTLYIEQLWSMIDFVQESGRARGSASSGRRRAAVAGIASAAEATETEIEMETETETETDESEEIDDS